MVYILIHSFNYHTIHHLYNIAHTMCIENNTGNT